MSEVLGGIVPTRVPDQAPVDTEVPGPVIVPTRVPRTAVVPTRVPFWLQQVRGLLRGQGRVAVHVMHVELDGSEALRGQGQVPATVVAMETGAQPQHVRGLGRVLAWVTESALSAETRELAGQGAVALSSVVRSLLTGVRELAGRGTVTAERIGFELTGGTRTAAGRGTVTGSATATELRAPVQAVAGRGAITVQGATSAMPFRQQRMNKRGATPIGRDTVITGWDSDQFYLAEVVNDTYLKVAAPTVATGIVTVYLIYESTSNLDVTVNIGGSAQTTRILSGTSGTNKTATITREFQFTSDGIQIGINATRTTIGAAVPGIKDGSYVQVVPE